MSELNGLTYQDKKEEAIRRLEMWKKKGLMHCVLRKFKKKDSELYYSELMAFGNTPFGSLFYFNELGGAQNKWKILLDNFEKEYNSLVYHVIHSYLGETEVLLFLFVSPYTHNWELDHKEIESGYPFVYACDINDPINSQFGNIECAISGGGMISI